MADKTKVVIEGVLTVSGPSRDLYSPMYFTTDTSFKQFLRDNPTCYLYGYRVAEYAQIPTVISVKMLTNLDIFTFTMVASYIEMEFTGDIPSRWLVDHPFEPPAEGWISDDIIIDMHNLRNRFIAQYDPTAPVYLNPQQEPTIVVHQNKTVGTNVLDIVSTKRPLHLNSTLVFVNGLCVYAEPASSVDYGAVLRVTNHTGILSNPDDRDRGIMMLDFGADYPLNFIKFNELEGTLDELDLGVKLDLINHSFILVLDGRAFFPGEFMLANRSGTTRIFFDAVERFEDAYFFDKFVCQKAFQSGTGNMVISKGDAATWKSSLNLNLKNSPNSFLVEIPRRGLRAFVHENETNILGDDIVSEEHRRLVKTTELLFKGNCTGLLMDRTTRSVVEYYTQEVKQGFVVDPTPTPVLWDRQILRVNKATPIKTWLPNDNLMSTYASMHDSRRLSGQEQVLWPRYVLLDLVFVS